MKMSVVISHQDADGVFCTAVYLMNNDKARCYYTSPAKLLKTICYTIIKNVPEELFIFDLSGNKKTLRAASVYDRVTWIDHHEWSEVEVPENIKVIIDSSAKSAAMLVGEYFDTKPEWLKLSEEIDTNNVITREAEELRGIITMLKRKNRNEALSKELYFLSKGLATQGLDILFASKYRSMLREYEAWKEELKERILPEIFNIEDKKIAVIEEKEFLPVYIVYNELKNHEEAPFDVILCIYRNFFTKLEFRTQTNFNVLELARAYGGGGHKKASGATIRDKISKEEILEKLSAMMKRGLAEP